MQMAIFHSFHSINVFTYLLCGSLGASDWGYDRIHHWLYGAHSLLMERGIHQIIEGMYTINGNKIYEGKIQASVIA